MMHITSWLKGLFQSRLRRQRKQLAKHLYQMQIRRRGALSLLQRQEIDVINLQCRQKALERTVLRLSEQNEHLRGELRLTNSDLVAARLALNRWIAMSVIQGMKVDTSAFTKALQRISDSLSGQSSHGTQG